MRKLLRGIARHNMETQKIEKKNKPVRYKKEEKSRSKFSRLWRDYVKSKYEVGKGTNTLYKKKPLKEKAAKS